MKAERFENIKVVFLIHEYEIPVVTLFCNPEDPIMTGVLSLRNLSIFSGLNSFRDLTFDQNYATAFMDLAFLSKISKRTL